MPLRCSIDSALWSLHPIWLGLTEWENTRVRTLAGMWCAELDSVCSELSGRFPNRNDLATDCRIAEGRAAYQSYGLNPKRHPPASEALIRRAISGKPLPSINTFVDFNNYLSLSTRCPVGSYNREAIRGEVLLRLGGPGEVYTAIGNEPFNVENFPTLCDENGPFGGITRDSLRTMVAPDIAKVATFVMSFVEPETSGLHDVVEKMNLIARERGLGEPAPLVWIGA